MLIEQLYKNFLHTNSSANESHSKPSASGGKHRLLKLCSAIAVAILLTQSSVAQTTLVDPTTGGGFESGTTMALNGWSTAQSPFNAWYVGTAAAGYTGARGVFIGSNSTTYNYTNTTSHSNLFRMITIPSNQPNLTISFKIKCTGNSTSNVLVYLIDNAYTPTAAQPPFTYNGNNTLIGQASGYYNYGSYTTVTINANCHTTGNYKLIFSWNNGATVNVPPAALDDISVVAGGCSSYSGTGYVLVGSLPYSSSGRTTCGKSDDFTSGNTTTCGSTSYLASEDEIFEFKPTSSGIATVALTNAGSSGCAIMLYKGCPSTSNPCGGGSTCVNYAQTSGSNKQLCGGVMQDSTYFVIVDGSSGCFSYDINIAVSSGVSNDAACGATAVTLGTLVYDDNSCASGTSEPATPSCWTVGNLNSLWYSFVAPTSGSVHISFLQQTLAHGQVELFSGSCGSLTSTGNCADYTAMNCGGATWSGLTSGATYYVRLDGYSNDVGSYGLAIDNAGGTLTPLSQDCNGAVEICNMTYTEPANSMGCGNVNDVPSAGSYSNPSSNPSGYNSGCLLSGELNPRWYRIDINTSGNLSWTLSCSAGGYFDWEMWNITGSSCSAIANNTLAPVRCNWNGPPSGSTGMEASPPIAQNYQAPLAVTAGETYVLCITNWSYIGTAPYSLNFSNSTCTFAGAVATWNGYSGTSWTQINSWSGCNVPPSCSISAVINATASNPTLSANATVKDLTINSGATLTINAGVTLSVCGNLTNNGNLNASGTSTIAFTGTGTQTVSGTLTGSSKFGNLTVTKSSGTVTLSNNIDVAGTFTTSNSTSVFNVNGKYMKLTGHFTNSSGSTTFTGTGSSTLEFNGTTNQNYTPGGSLTLNNVTMNQGAATTVTLNGGNMTLSGILTLTMGRISTSSNEVSVTNTSVGSVPVGNANSYVDGNLRRSVSTTGSYNFPVGESSSGKGWQRANINFTSASNVTNLLAIFHAYGAVPSALGTADCSYTYNMPALDNGYWTITATPAMTSGAYTTTLYNTSGTYTNATGATNWTVMKNDGGGWFIDGTCASSTVNTVVRTGMSGFSYFGTAQSSTVLPIQLVSFTGSVLLSGNWLQWITSSELNNDYFVVERSADGSTFTDMLRVKGAGTTPEQHSYEGYDLSPFNGMNYYRLRQVDFDGHSTYSNVVGLNNYSHNEIVTSINPNPTTGDIHIGLDMPVNAVVKVEVLNIFGAVINSISAEVKSGYNSIPAMLNATEGGVYLLRITCDEIGYSFQTSVVKY